MNYLRMQFCLQKCTVEESENGENTLVIPITEEIQKKDLINLCQLIKHKFSTFSGVLIEHYPNSCSEDYILFTENHEIQLNHFLSEQLNVPVIPNPQTTSQKHISELFTKEEQAFTWTLDYHGYPKGREEYSIETMLTVGNGYIGLRGTLPEMQISESNYPATYLAGLYNSVDSVVAGKTITNEDFVNAPNLQCISLQIGDGPLVTIENDKIENLKRTLHLKTGLFEASFVVILTDQKKLQISCKKIVNMCHKNEYALSYTFTPLNFSEKITVFSTADGEVYNFNVARYRNLNKQHLKDHSIQFQENNMILSATTTSSEFEIIQKATLLGDCIENKAVKTELQNKKAVQSFVVNAKVGESYTVEKIVEVFSLKKSEKIKSEKIKSENFLEKSFHTMYSESTQAWKALWQESDICVKQDLMSQKMLRLHTYHLLCSASPYSNPDLDVSVTARGLHGEAYRGHIFWDEIFILPFYIIHYPKTAKQLLMYRYNRLPQAKKDSISAGYQGAMYPWQSGLDGSEQSQELHLNPLNNQWDEDHSRLQRHVSLAIAYNIWLYWKNTQDQTFMTNYGLEMLLEIAKFWISTASYDAQKDRYFIDRVMGPDEFHEAYPNSTQSGLKNNAYTNMMVVWLLEVVSSLLSETQEDVKEKLFQKIDFSKHTLQLMQEIQHKLEIEINSEGIIAQFEGYFDLKELDWSAYREKYGNIYRMDRILRAEGKSPDDYQVSKQADTLMTFYNFKKTRIDQILTDLGYSLPTNYLSKNLHYYLARTSHGSTLSRIVHAQLAQEISQTQLSWELYQEALFSDYRDIQGGTTAEGIHAGVMAATLYVTLTTFAGLDIQEDIVTIEPNLPEKWSEIQFNVLLRAVHYRLKINKEMVEVSTDKKTVIQVGKKVYELLPEKKYQIHY